MGFVRCSSPTTTKNEQKRTKKRKTCWFGFVRHPPKNKQKNEPKKLNKKFNDFGSVFATKNEKRTQNRTNKKYIFLSGVRHPQKKNELKNEPTFSFLFWWHGFMLAFSSSRIFFLEK